jgi:hypothetical protein
VIGDDEDGACVEAGEEGGGRGAELLTVLDVGCAEDGAAWVPEGLPF